eukprot:gene8750-biopygen18154
MKPRRCWWTSWGASWSSRGTGVARTGFNQCSQQRQEAPEASDPPASPMGRTMGLAHPKAAPAERTGHPRLGELRAPAARGKGRRRPSSKRARGTPGSIGVNVTPLPLPRQMWWSSGGGAAPLEHPPTPLLRLCPLRQAERIFSGRTLARPPLRWPPTQSFYHMEIVESTGRKKMLGIACLTNMCIKNQILQNNCE